jgi:cysteine-rich repeat protein
MLAGVRSSQWGACTRFVSALACTWFLGACSSDQNGGGNPMPDAAAPDAPGQGGTCGNGIVEPGEQCDDGNQSNDDSCLNNCHLACGDGVKNASEQCDTGIAAGMPGACPSSCDDGNACTSDTLSGSDCQAQCIHGAITMAINGDGCCPPGATSATDSDCTASCGNGVVDSGETCDTAIAAGMAGACPTESSCNDNQPCTHDSLANAGTCTAACQNTPITQAINGDGCCPPGATHATDSDCPASCGNGVVDSGETCDTAIAAGSPGACPTVASCNDNMACTRDTLLSGGTCNAACSHTAITQPMNGDGCCPPGANANNDNDCQPRCGNGVVESGEQCDDGNTTSGDGCSATCQLEPKAYRMVSLSFKDPHVYVNAIIACIDVTNSAPFGMASLNQRISDSISMDVMPMDGFLDLNILMVFRPLNQTPGGQTPMSVTFGKCTAPAAGTTCRPNIMQTSTTASNLASGMCLGVLPGTHTQSYGAITIPQAPCFESAAGVTLTILLNGITLPMHDARVAATYSGNPASQLVNGLIRGFVTEADANALILPANLGPLSGHPLSFALPGGSPPAPEQPNCENSDHSDMDTGPDGQRGWYFYLNFTAAPVSYTDMP